MNSPADLKKPIVLDSEVFKHLPADVRFDALLLKRMNRLVIQGTPQGGAA